MQAQHYFGQVSTHRYCVFCRINEKSVRLSDQCLAGRCVYVRLCFLQWETWWQLPVSHNSNLTGVKHIWPIILAHSESHNPVARSLTLLKPIFWWYFTISLIYFRIYVILPLYVMIFEPTTTEQNYMQFLLKLFSICTTSASIHPSLRSTTDWLRHTSFSFYFSVKHARIDFRAYWGISSRKRFSKWFDSSRSSIHWCSEIKLDTTFRYDWLVNVSVWLWSIERLGF